MSAAWRILQTDFGYPHLISVGCAAHSVNLLIQSIFENIPIFGSRLDECTAISKFVKNRQAMLARLGTAQFDQETRRALSLPVATRWYTHETCMKSVVINMTALKGIFADQELMSRYRTAATRPAVTLSIQDTQFWLDAEVIFTLLDPISDALALLESDDSTISMLNECFNRLATNELNNEPQTTVCTEIQALILSEINSRWRTARSDVADVAYLLDPRLAVGAFAQDTVQDLIEKAVRLARKTEGLDDTRATTLRNAITNFVTQKLVWTADQRERKSAYTPSKWWSLRPHLGDLSRFAKRLLSIPASSAASERSWSIHSFIHSKTRSRLLTDRVSKLAYIYSNIGHERQPRLLEEDLAFVMEEDKTPTASGSAVDD